MQAGFSEEVKQNTFQNIIIGKYFHFIDHTHKQNSLIYKMTERTAHVTARQAHLR